MTMVPPETLLLSGYDCGYNYNYSYHHTGCGGRLTMSDHDRVDCSNGEDCSVSDRTADINGTHNNSCSNNDLSMAIDIRQNDSRTNDRAKEEDAGSALKDVTAGGVISTNNTIITTDFDQTHTNKDEGWLRLGIGGRQTENPPETTTAKYKGSCDNVNDDQAANRREGLLELNLFSGAGYTSATGASVYHAPPPQPQHQNHHQLIMNSAFGASLFYQQLFRPQLLHQSPSFLSSSSSSSPSPSPSPSAPWMPLMGPYSFTRPFRPPPLPPLGLINNNIRVDNVAAVAGPSSDFRVVDPPRRPHSGVWFVLQASQNQAKEPFLPQVNKSYLRIKDGRMTVRLLMKYLVKKLQLDSESEIEIRCRGEQLAPIMTMEHVRDTIWIAKDYSSSSSLTLLPLDSSTDHHLMILHYGRIA